MNLLINSIAKDDDSDDEPRVDADGNLINPLSLEEQQARTNLVATIIGAIAEGAGLDTAAATTAAQIETENNAEGQTGDIGDLKEVPLEEATTEAFRQFAFGTPAQKALFALANDAAQGIFKSGDPELINALIAVNLWSNNTITVEQAAAIAYVISNGDTELAGTALPEVFKDFLRTNSNDVSGILPQQSSFRYFIELEVAQRNLTNAQNNLNDLQSTNGDPDQIRLASTALIVASNIANTAASNFDLSKTPAGRAVLQNNEYNSQENKDERINNAARSEVNKLLAVAFAGPAIGAGAALLPEAIAAYTLGNNITAGVLAVSGIEQITGGLNSLASTGASQTGIVGGFINAATGTRAGDTISTIIQLGPDLFTLATATGQSIRFTSRADALAAADELDRQAFNLGLIDDLPPNGSQRQIQQPPSAIRDDLANSAGPIADDVDDGNVIVVTGKRLKTPITSDTTPTATRNADDTAGATFGSRTAEEIFAAVDDLDVSTPVDSAVFYSGRGAREAAEEFAESRGLVSLENTNGGNTLDDLRLYEGTVDGIGNVEADQVWTQLSSRFAREASGSVTAVVNNPRPGSIFLHTELPALLNNPNVIEIVVRNISGQQVRVPKGTPLNIAMDLIGGLK